MRSIGKSIVAVFAVIGVIASVQQLRGQSTSPFEGSAVGHVGIIVNDMDKTLKVFEQVFGVAPGAAREVGPIPVIGYGDNTNTRVKFIQVTFGGTVFEFIQPVSGPGPHKEHLDKFGQGLQHIAFNVKDPKAATVFLQGMGVRQTMGNYFDMKEQLGFTFELAGFPKPKQ